MAELHLRGPNNSLPESKSKPEPSSIPVPFTYNASDDGADENLLILLHGLGDTNVPFGKLGRSLNLPQTATLALRAPQQVPFLYEQAFQWYTSFDPLGELLERPDPTPALDLMREVLNHLTHDCGWPAGRIHLFGFAQGGTVAAESALRWWRAELEKQREQQKSSGAAQYVPRPLASVVSVCGILLSYPTLSPPCSTPILIYHRPPPAETALPSGALTSYKKGFSHVNEVKMGGGEGMPKTKDEWEPIMRFWSERLSRRKMEGLYEVMTGVVP